MLTDEQKQDIETGIARYPNRQAVGIDALKRVQADRGWVSDEDLADLAGFLGRVQGRVDNAIPRLFDGGGIRPKDHQRPTFSLGRRFDGDFNGHNLFDLFSHDDRFNDCDRFR